MRFDVITLFPELFAPFLDSGVTRRAYASGQVDVRLWNPREFAEGNYRRVDDRPFGGGPGMVMMCQPVWDAVAAVEAMDPRPASRIVLSPQGTPLNQAMVEELARRPRLLLIAGHYEGLDERVIEKLKPLEISLGDYILSGGELAAMVLIDAIIRKLPGALGHEDSSEEDSFSPRGPAGAHLLDCPHYTKPREWMGLAVPDVLLSGDHGKIAAWRLSQMVERTRTRRPDLLTDQTNTTPGFPPK
jgi:tRNA (guanine37-N1)-methyltransferase